MKKVVVVVVVGVDCCDMSIGSWIVGACNIATPITANSQHIKTLLDTANEMVIELYDNTDNTPIQNKRAKKGKSIKPWQKSKFYEQCK